MTDELAAFVRGAVASMGEDYDQPDDEELDDQPADDESDDADAEWNRMTPQQAWASLDIETAEQIAADPELAEQWRRALAGEDWEDEPDDGSPDERLSTREISESTRSLIGGILDDADGWAASEGEDPVDRLFQLMTISPAEWRASAAEAGWPEDARPGYNDLSDELKVEWHSRFLERKAEEIARTGRGYL